jgi:hypothetical protein
MYWVFCSVRGEFQKMVQVKQRPRQQGSQIEHNDPAADREENQDRMNFFDKYHWWFVVLGLIGNGLFFTGSICFLFKSLETLSISLFIAGSCFMLVSSSADSIAEYSRSQLE